MGLDMYIFKDGDEELAYWRKVNQIHGWFINHFGVPDDGNPIKITIDDMMSLKSDLDVVINEFTTHKTITTKCKELFPRTAGFLFGSLEYDKWYVNELCDSYGQIIKVIHDMLTHPDSEYEYVPDW